MHPNSRIIFEKHALAHFRDGLRILEIGPDGFPSTYRGMVEARGTRSLVWETIDLFADPRLTFVAESEYVFPVPRDTYDIVLSGQVIEHVRKPWVWIKEVARVCRPGGIVITVNPVSWPYHEAPIDCWRVFPQGMQALYDEAALDVLVCEWGSFELPGYRRYVPGASEDNYGRRRRIINRALGYLGIPVERAYDTVTVGRKRSTG